MKPEELMLGDWVYMDQNDIPRTISDIDRFGTVQSFGIARYVNNIYPIPLTPEILEKNGWSHTKLHGSYGRKGMRIDGPPYEELPDGIKNALDFAQWSIDEEYQYHRLDIYMWRGNIRLWVNYVHELQHALRLCGIDKEIVI